MKITTHLDYISHCKTASLVQIGRVDGHIEYFRKILAAIRLAGVNSRKLFLLT